MKLCVAQNHQKFFFFFKNCSFSCFLVYLIKTISQWSLVHLSLTSPGNLALVSFINPKRGKEYENFYSGMQWIVNDSAKSSLSVFLFFIYFFYAALLTLFDICYTTGVWFDLVTIIYSFVVGLGSYIFLSLIKEFI